MTMHGQNHIKYDKGFICSKSRHRTTITVRQIKQYSSYAKHIIHTVPYRTRRFRDINISNFENEFLEPQLRFIVK